MKKVGEKKVDRILRGLRVEPGKKFRLSRRDPADTGGLSLESKHAKELLRSGVERLAELQGKLYAQDQWGVLLIFQAMDAAGKDGTIKHVMSGINPQGCQVYSFKGPSAEELDHDFLWRTMKCLPERGRIGIFNRSLLRGGPRRARAPRVPRERRSCPRRWSPRTSGRSASRTSTPSSATSRATAIVVVKFFLNVSKKEQKKRFLERLDDAREELEVLGQRREGARVLGRLHDALRRHARRRRARTGRRGTSSPPTTSGSRAWP